MKRNLKSFICFSLFTFHFLLLVAQNGWVMGRFGMGSGEANSVAIDNNGNIFLSGYFSLTNSNELSFGPYNLYNNNRNIEDAFIAKYDQYGNIQWARQTICSGAVSLNPEGFRTSLDKMGNAYLMANFSDSMKVPPYLLNTPSYNSVMYLAKYDPNGNVVWARQSYVPVIDTGGAAGNYICTGVNGDSYITGLFAPISIFGKDTIRGNLNGNAFLVKYDANGNEKWVKATWTKSNACGAQGEGASLDRYGNVYITGSFTDTVAFGTDTLKGAYQNGRGADDFFIAKYDSIGNMKWIRRDKLPSVFCYGLGQGVTCDQGGNVYVIGNFMDTLILDKDTLISSCYTIFNHDLNHTNFFIAKYDSTGNLKWAIQDNTPVKYGTSAWGISSDTMGHIYVSANVGVRDTCTVAIGNATVKTKIGAGSDAPGILLKLDTAGHLLCVSMFPYAGAEYNSVVSDPTGNYVYYGGTLITEAIFGGDTINPSASGYVPLLARWQECEPTLSVTEIKEKSTEVRVYPNPNNGRFTMLLSNINIVCNVEVYNVLGKKVYAETLQQSQINSINLTGQPNGVYLYRVTTLTGELVGEGKLVKQ